MKFFSFFLLIALQLPSTANASLFCRIFGNLARRSSSAIGNFLNRFIAGKEINTGMRAPYSDFRIDLFQEPEFDGCTVSLTADITFLGTISLLDESGVATIDGTLQLTPFIFSFFRSLCFEDLEVKDLNFESPPGQVVEDWTRAYINEQFENPECFEE